MYDAAHEAADFPAHQPHLWFLLSKASFHGKLDWLHRSSMFSLIIVYTSSWRPLSMALPSINFTVMRSIVSPKLEVIGVIHGEHVPQSGIVKGAIAVGVLNEFPFT